jgi:transcriptional regulator with XRE-family HTH domain
MFELARQRKLPLEKLADLGGNLYSANYLYKIRKGSRPVPDSLSFQNWIAEIFGISREALFLPGCVQEGVEEAQEHLFCPCVYERAQIKHKSI